MRVGVIQNFKAQNISFGNLTPEEKQGFIKTKEAALDIIGRPDRSVFVYSSACLPQSAESNTGIGTLVSKQGEELLDVVKTYTTANVMQDLPSGELLPNPPKSFYCAYEGSGHALSEHLIEPEILMDEKFGSLIKPEELKTVVEANNGKTKDVLANFENVIEPNSPFDNMLRKAHARFKNGKGDTLKAMRAEFKEYNAQNADWLESHAIHQVLSKKYETPVFGEWPEEVDRRLYDPEFPETLRTARKNNILKEDVKEIDFYKFKKFMADKCLGLAREKANEKGFKFGGDIAYQFNLADMFGSPKAFSYNVYMGQPDMKIPALNFYQIADPNSPAAKLLIQKTRLAAQRYDTLRMDMGWGYITPILSNTEGTYYEQKPMGSQVLEMIENTVKEVKGDKFNPKDIFYEVEAGIDDFRSFNDDGSLIEPLRGRMKIYSSNYMNDGWGSNNAYLNKFHFSPDEFIYGAANRDTTPLAELATSKTHAARKAEQVNALAKIFNVKPSALRSTDEFIRAKNAEPLMAKNNFTFFTEFFGMVRKFNAHNDNGAENFRPKIPANPEQAYFDAVKEGRAFNLMDAFERIFKSEGLDKKHPELYEKIVEFKNKLYDIKPAPVEEVIEEAARTSTTNSTATSETVEKTVKSSKYMKPVLIAVGALAVLYAVYKLFIAKPKAA